jgi:DNA-binding NarL/FixJ family response regulator
MEPYEDRFCSPMADVVLIDMEHPYGDHLALLKTLASDSFNSMPLVLLSNNPNPETVKQGFDRGANSFVAKRNGEAELKEVLDSIQQIKTLWDSYQAKIPA